MNVFGPDTLHRTTKLELDEGRAQTLEDAELIASRYVLQIDVGKGITESPTRQAMLLTVVNTASRAFIGGVRVRLPENGPMTVPWAEGQDIATSVKAFGGDLVQSLEKEYPTIVVGDVVEHPSGSVVLFATWEGWSGAIVQDQENRLPERSEFPLAGVLAAALGVSEAFQHVREFALAGRRSIGLSLWQPGGHWRGKSAYGQPCQYLPSRLWLIGLGHLGQAYAWGIGMMPYQETVSVEITLQDYDSIVEANKSTGLLSDDRSVGQRKSRAVAKRLEALGFKTTITERRFSNVTQRGIGDPGVALSGIDDPGPRRFLEEAGFDLIVDAGLGGNSQNYLDILIHSFPSEIKAAEAWPERRISPPNYPGGQPAYLDQRRQMRETTNLTDGEIECGIVEVAGRSVGASFVGCVAAALVLCEVLRSLIHGPRFQILSLSLRSPDTRKAILKIGLDPNVNLGFVPAGL